MSPVEIAALVAVCGYAVYRQSIKHEIVGANRFRMAIIYGIVGLVLGGVERPHGGAAISLLAGSIVLSVAVGIARGQLTHVWRDSDGKVYSQGTRLSIGLFLAMIVVKFGMGTWAYLHHVDDNGGFGEILLMLAVMLAFQTQLVWRRAEKLGAPRTAPHVEVGV